MSEMSVNGGEIVNYSNPVNLRLLNMSTQIPSRPRYTVITVKLFFVLPLGSDQCFTVSEHPGDVSVSLSINYNFNFYKASLQYVHAFTLVWSQRTNKRNNLEKMSTSKKAEHQSHTYLLHNHHGPMIVQSCLAAGVNFTRKFALQSSFKLHTNFVLALFLVEMASHQFDFALNMSGPLIFDKDAPSFREKGFVESIWEATLDLEQFWADITDST